MTLNQKILYDLDLATPTNALALNLRLITDDVMGGKSSGKLERQELNGRNAVRMLGEVSLANNGGFIQASLDLTTSGQFMDASMWNGIELEVLGNNEEYEVRLRTENLAKPWQSYRHSFFAEPAWKMINIPFSQFEPHRTDIPLNLAKLRRLSIVAIGRNFFTDIAFTNLHFYK